MIISCPECRSRYRINPVAGSKSQARVKCPNCRHTFAIALPAGDDIGGAVIPGTGRNPEPAEPLVLVVDDARFFREMICDLLADLPIRLETAGDGEEALQKLRSMHPSLLLVDLNIPGLSGQELIAAVRRDPSCVAVRILAISGVQRGEETAQDIRRLGADDFINKSFKPRDLQNRVRQFLGL